MPDGFIGPSITPDGSVVVYEGVRATADNAGEVGIFAADPTTGQALPDVIARPATSGYLAGAAVAATAGMCLSVGPEPGFAGHERAATTVTSSTG